MKNTIGHSVTLTLFGESHGTKIGAALDGLAPGMTVDLEYINKQLSLRRPVKGISTSRIEQDKLEIVSGSLDGKTTGAPLTILIENADTRSGDYNILKEVARPSHADFAANEKYHGFQDTRGGGHFSGRITAPIVASGAILLDALSKIGIKIGTHIKMCKNICDRDFDDFERDIEYLSDKEFAVLDEGVEQKMRNEIVKARQNGDSIGGILETVITGMPTGVGEPWFDTLEGELAHAFFSIPAVKGVEFGAGFAMCQKYGSEVNDEFYAENGKILTKTNNSGGVNGGISNGMPIIIRTAVKPTPTIFKEQNTVNFINKENTTLIPKGRHDPCIVNRARIVADSMAALVIADMLALRFGTDYLSGGGK